MAPRPGTVATNGATYFSHPDLNEVRAFLRDAGLEIAGTIAMPDKPVWMGWTTGDERRRGAIYFENGLHVGSWWQSETGGLR